MDNDFGEDDFEEDTEEPTNKEASPTKEDIFNNSRIKDNKPEAAVIPSEEDEEEDPEAQAILIESEFKKIYDSDP